MGVAVTKPKRRHYALDWVGQDFAVPHPFTRTTYDAPDGSGEHPTWAPGYIEEPDGHVIAHGFGAALYHVVSVHELPRPYHTRVFYTRQWRDPNGRVFGKRGILITTVTAFRRRLKGPATWVTLDKAA